MPSGAVHEDDGVRAPGDMAADIVEMVLHGLGVGRWHHDGGAHAACGADRAEEIGVLVSLVGWQARSRAFSRPYPGTPVLLADPCFILKPEFDRRILGQVAYMSGEGSIEVFLKLSMMRVSCAGCCGRPLICEKPSSLRSSEMARSL